MSLLPSAKVVTAQAHPRLLQHPTFRMMPVPQQVYVTTDRSLFSTDRTLSPPSAREAGRGNALSSRIRKRCRLHIWTAEGCDANHAGEYNEDNKCTVPRAAAVRKPANASFTPDHFAAHKRPSFGSLRNLVNVPADFTAICTGTFESFPPVSGIPSRAAVHTMLRTMTV
ncbi:hypothetical protein B0H13DRAFT_2325263 [Mycena leptocephala]|nr:hypothetical protein B0H13DRAFT_2325263 [Mycena leptocephala]